MKKDRKVIYLDEWIKNKLKEKPVYLVDTDVGMIEWAVISDPSTWSVDDASGVWIRGDR